MASIAFRICWNTVPLILILLCGDSAAPRAEEGKAAPCRDDAMIVFDASGSMSGNQTLASRTPRPGSMRCDTLSLKCYQAQLGYGRWDWSASAPALGTSAMSSSTSHRQPTLLTLS